MICSHTKSEIIFFYLPDEEIKTVKVEDNANSDEEYLRQFDLDYTYGPSQSNFLLICCVAKDSLLLVVSSYSSGSQSFWPCGVP